MENMTLVTPTENATLLTKLLLLLSETFAENSTNSNSGKNVEFETSYDCIMCVLSFISVVIHLFKFFKSRQKQNLQIKNLTNYCACLFFTYLVILVHVTTDVSSHFPQSFLFVDLYLHIAEPVFILIMSFYTCLCIIVSQKSYQVRLSDDRQFLLYSIIGWVLPLLLAAAIFILQHTHYLHIITILFFRLLASIIFFVSLWYLRSIGWKRTNIIKNFVIHLRLLTLTGTISIIPDMMYGIFLILDQNASSLLTKTFEQISDVFYYPRGFIVGLCFTFRKGTFENRIEDPVEMTDGCVTEAAQVIGDE